MCRKGENTQKSLEQIIENSTRYRARALIDLGTIEVGIGNFDIGLKHYAQAIKYASDIRALSQAKRSIAAVKGLEGFHKQSRKDLERIGPLIKYSQPIENYQYLNSFAVELAEVGRVKEAANISRIVLASPYAFAYPEWRETANEIALRGYKSRSFVSFTQKKPGNLRYLPEREPADTPVQQGRARILNYLEWKKKMVKEPNGNGENDVDSMSDKDIFFEIMHIASQDSITREQLEEILESVKKITTKKP